MRRKRFVLNKEPKTVGDDAEFDLHNAHQLANARATEPPLCCNAATSRGRAGGGGQIRLAGFVGRTHRLKAGMDHMPRNLRDGSDPGGCQRR